MFTADIYELQTDRKRVKNGIFCRARGLMQACVWKISRVGYQLTCMPHSSVGGKRMMLHTSYSIAFCFVAAITASGVKAEERADASAVRDTKFDVFVSSNSASTGILRRGAIDVKNHAGVTSIAKASALRLTVNGEERVFAASLSVRDLLGDIGLESLMVAVERNLMIVPRSLYANTLLRDGDRLEIFQLSVVRDPDPRDPQGKRPGKPNVVREGVKEESSRQRKQALLYLGVEDGSVSAARLAPSSMTVREIGSLQGKESDQLERKERLEAVEATGSAGDKPIHFVENLTNVVGDQTVTTTRTKRAKTIGTTEAGISSPLGRSQASTRGLSEMVNDLTDDAFEVSNGLPGLKASVEAKKASTGTRKSINKATANVKKSKKKIAANVKKSIKKAAANVKKWIKKAAAIAKKVTQKLRKSASKVQKFANNQLKVRRKKIKN